MSEYILKITNHPNPKDPLNTGKGWGTRDPMTRQYLKEEREKQRDYEKWLRKRFLEVEWVKEKKYWRPRENTGIWVAKTRKRRK